MTGTGSPDGDRPVFYPVELAFLGRTRPTWFDNRGGKPVGMMSVGTPGDSPALDDLDLIERAALRALCADLIARLDRLAELEDAQWTLCGES